ncbi:LuxR C-terminal-related transcriptional regulator [Phycicoccus avicenniae]|uniref:LuxR C-terminal-related transcriptional regulator n=1 Tax=Phycicoccus avicenniae TaxID=2828860 RepID=UPI003D2C4371
MSTIADRVRESAAREFVGRRRELDVLVGAVRATDPPFLVAVVHGPGGIGKSSLVRRALAAMPADVRCVHLDGRDVEPTPEGFCRAVGGALGIADPAPTPATLARALDGRRTVLVVDTYEVLGLLDAWLRTRFLPAMPASTLTVLAGRDRPAAAWYSAPGWGGLVTELPLGALEPDDADALLRSRGLDAEQASRAADFARGHPLALELAAASVRADPAGDRDGPSAPAGLLEAFLGDLSGPVVEAVEAASTVRRVTQPLLAAVLGGADDRFDLLRDLPFVEAAGDGLLLHDVVRDTVGQDLAVRDPERRRTYRRRALEHLTARGAGSDSWQHTADLMFLVENPVLRDACFPSARPEHWVEAAGPQDRTAVLDITARHEPEAARRLLEQWWDRHPGSFSVARGAGGEVEAFVQIIPLDEADPVLLQTDPVAAEWAAHLREDPVPPDGTVLLMRRWLGRDSGELRSPAVSACWLDVKRVYMQQRPRLRRIYSVVGDLGRLGPVFVPLGFGPVGDAVDLGGGPVQPVRLDFGPGSVDGWLARLVGSEAAAPAPGDAAPAGTVAGLSSRELEVLRLVATGRTNREIGGLLFISEKTASRHLSNIFDKLGIRSRAEASRIAAENGLTAG